MATPITSAGSPGVGLDRAVGAVATGASSLAEAIPAGGTRGRAGRGSRPATCSRSGGSTHAGALAAARPGALAGLDPDESVENNASVVVLVEDADGLRMLLTGDLEPSAQRALLRVGRRPARRRRQGRAPRLGLPGPGVPARDRRPTLAVVSVGADNTYGHPSATTLGALRATGAEVRRTDQLGDIAVGGGRAGLGHDLAHDRRVGRARLTARAWHGWRRCRPPTASPASSSWSVPRRCWPSARSSGSPARSRAADPETEIIELDGPTLEVGRFLELAGPTLFGVAAARAGRRGPADRCGRRQVRRVPAGPGRRRGRRGLARRGREGQEGARRAAPDQAAGDLVRAAGQARGPGRLPPVRGRARPAGRSRRARPAHCSTRSGATCARPRRRPGSWSPTPVAGSTRQWSAATTSAGPR